MEEEKTIINDPNPGVTFLNGDMGPTDLSQHEVELSQTFFANYATDEIRKELDADLGDGLQLGNSKTLINHVLNAAKRQMSDLAELEQSEGNRFYGNPPMTAEDEARVDNDGKILLMEAIEKARAEFILKSGRSLPGRMHKV